MGLSHWDIDHVFLDCFYEGDVGDDFKVTAVTECRWQYLSAKIKWYLPSAIRHDRTTLDKILVHELCHVLLSPEQSLVDARIQHDATAKQLKDIEHQLLADRNYEQLELSTEMACRAIWKAWEDWENLPYEVDADLLEDDPT